MIRSTNTQNALLGMTLLFGMVLTACGSDNDSDGGTGPGFGDPGVLNVLVEPEDSITDGLDAGESVANIQDGWTVRFSKYIIVTGDIDLYYSSDESVEAEDDALYAIDLTKVDATGFSLWTLDNLRPGDWEFNYSVAGAQDGAMRHETVDEVDFDDMVDKGLSYIIEGTLSKDDGESCPPQVEGFEVGDASASGNTNSRDESCYANTEIAFRIEAEAEAEGDRPGTETYYGPCQLDDVAGFNMPEGGSQSVALTIHGDHIFFNGFPEGSEGGVKRLAQWLADSDLDVDGTVTREELEAIDTSDLAEFDADDYELGGASVEFNDMHGYIIAQLKTQGHFQGEGACAVDGVEHDHSGHSHGDDDGHDHGDDDHDDHDHDADHDHGDDDHDDHDHDA